MSTFLSARKTPIISAAGAAITLAVGLLSTVAAPAAHALPVAGKCSIITYYGDAAHTTKVGSFSSCPPTKGLTGVRSKFFEVEEFDLANPGPRPKPPGTKTLPCEFLANCSVNLPVAR
jgi:hypothetical protein